MVTVSAVSARGYEVVATRVDPAGDGWNVVAGFGGERWSVGAVAARTPEGALAAALDLAALNGR